MNNHQDGVAPSQFETNAQLASFYNLLSTNVDRDGNPFGSTMEGLCCSVMRCRLMGGRQGVSNLRLAVAP